MQKIYIHSANSYPCNIENVDNVATLLTEILTNECSKRVFIVRGNKSYFNSGAHKLIEEAVKNISLETSEFYSFSVNPKWEDVENGMKHVKSFGPDLLISIGGGSVIDMAKLLKHYTQTNIPLISIPTTAGTGAESTAFAVCYFDGVKKSIAAADMLSEYVILVPDLTLNNNEYLTACTGFDAFAQAIEAYWNINATTESDNSALFAIRLLYNNLKQPLGSINRTQMLVGSNLAGRAINITKTTAPHAMSYTFTSHYGYPHGHAVALTFPFFFERNIKCVQTEYSGNDYKSYTQKMNLLLKIFGLKSSDDLYVFMRDFITRLGLGYDDNRKFEPEIVEKGINLERAKNNPLILNKGIIHQAVNSIKQNIS